MLNLTQPALTRGIRQLESELGVTLFQRLPRSMRLTRFGESFRRHAQSVFVQLEDARAELNHLSQRMDEEILIGAGPTWLMGSLPEIAGQISRRYPHVAIKVRGGYDRQLIHMLRSGEVEFILTEISRSPDLADVRQEPLVHSRYVVACGRNHPLAKERRISLERLLEFPWAMPDQSVNAHERLNGVFRSENLSPPVPLLQSTSLSFILRLLERSDALAFVVESSVIGGPRNSIVALDVDHQLPVRYAGIVQRPDSWISPASAALLEELRNHCRKNPIQ